MSVEENVIKRAQMAWNETPFRRKGTYYTSVARGDAGVDDNWWDVLNVGGGGAEGLPGANSQDSTRSQVPRYVRTNARVRYKNEKE